MISSGNPDYYSPLTTNSFKNGIRGPSTCAFSSPKVTYSQETQDFVNLLMNETRLTTSQRKGFQSLLRSGDVTPESTSTAMARRQEYLRRRVEKGKAIGLDIPSGPNVNKFRKVPGNQVGGGRRSLDAIKATGVLNCPPISHTYVPVQKEVEKVRFSYKMAYGEEPSEEMMKNLMGKGKDKRPKIPRNVERPICNKSPKSSAELDQERLNELIEEIRDRVEFMEFIGKAKRKEHQGSITHQIRQKLAEVKSLFPEKVAEIVKSFRLVTMDPLFAEI